jgi:hypothetical protein
MVGGTEFRGKLRKHWAAAPAGWAPHERKHAIWTCPPAIRAAFDRQDFFPFGGEIAVT